MALRLIVAAIVVVLFAPGALFAGGADMIKPGLYEINMKMETQGRRVKLQQCYKKEDFEGDTLAKSFTSGQGTRDCVVGDFKQSGDTVTWKLDCAASGMKGTGEIIYRGEGYTGTMTYEKGTGGGTTRSMTDVTEAKRLGKCK